MSSRPTTVTLRVLAVGLVGLAAAFGVERVLADEGTEPTDATSTTTTTITITSTPPTTSTITTTTVPMDAGQRLCDDLKASVLGDDYRSAEASAGRFRDGDADSTDPQTLLGRKIVRFCLNRGTSGITTGGERTSVAEETTTTTAPTSTTTSTPSTSTSAPTTQPLTTYPPN